MKTDEQPDTQPVAVPEEAAPEAEADSGGAWPPPSEGTPGFSVRDRRRFANLTELPPHPEEAPAPEVGPPVASPSEIAREPASWAALESEEEPEEEPWVELQQELRRVGRELFKNTRQAEANLQIFGEVLEEIQRLPAVYSETVWQMKAGLLKEVLGVLDGLEASLRAGQEMLTRLSASAQPPRSSWWNFFSPPRESADLVAPLRQWLEGQQILHRRLLSILHSQGVQQIESVGQRFDSRLHRAVALEARSDLPPGTILTEEVKGYMLDGRILRYAEVVVSNHEQNNRN
ncbi:MAG: nucleotide exchange factor GrpE [Acidobacteria bacterium]|nr:nucleotide exchange factor GrpE [Acidobacteriota bacterium]